MRSVAGRLAALLLLPAALALGACSAPAPTTAAAPGLSRLPPVPPGEVAPTDNLPACYSSAQEPTADNAAASSPLVTPARLARGYTIVVVGVNGDNSLSAGLAPGLVAGGYAGAVEVIDWTTGYWPLFVYHLRAEARHKAGAELIARKIAAYQNRYPGREVNLVGYSAGAVVAVEAVETLDPGRRVDRLVLLAGASRPPTTFPPYCGAPASAYGATINRKTSLRCGPARSWSARPTDTT